MASHDRLAQVIVEPLLRIAVGRVERPDPQVTADGDCENGGDCAKSWNVSRCPA
jgi:hypothetical protein